MSKRAAVIWEDDGIYVRQSAVSQYGLCPASIGGEDDWPTPATTFGTAFHFLPEELAMTSGRGTTTKAAALSMIHDALALDGFAWADTGRPLSALDDMAEELLYAMQEFMDVIAPNIPWGEVEAEVQGQVQVDTLAGVPIYITGTPDLVHWPTMAMWDWKTAGKGWHESRKAKEQQARLYPVMVDPEWDEHVNFHYVVYDRSKGMWDAHTVTSSPRERRAWLGNAARVAKLLAERSPQPYKVVSDAFITKRNWFCKPAYCPAWNTCIGKYAFDDGSVDLDEPRVMEW